MKTKSTRSVVALAAALLALNPVLAATDTDQQAWDGFIAWVKTQPRTSTRTDWQRYQEKLVADGFTPESAAERMALLGRMFPTHRQEFGQIAMNRLYAAQEQTRFSTAPNAFLVATLRDLELPPGKALDVAMGQGRNAVHLARLGWDVTGIDLADEGLRVARESAAAVGTRIETVQASFEAFDYGENQWDLISFIYTDAPVLEPAYVQRIIAALKPGGLLILERPHRLLDEEDPELGAMMPSDVPNALTTAWKDLHILHYEDRIGFSEWQQTSVDRHQKRLRIIRLLAQKR